MGEKLVTEDHGPNDWQRIQREHPRTAREALWMKTHVRFSTLPKPGLPMDDQPARFVVLLNRLTSMGVLRGQ